MENIKIRVTDNQRPAAIQNYLFASGYRWPISGTEIQVSGAKEGDGFYGTSDGLISWDQKRHFDESNFEEIFFAHKGDDFTEVPVDMVNNPSHYTSHPSGIECIEITRHMGFNLGNAMKYIWRCDLKKDAIEDLKKAVFYLNDEIALREKLQESFKQIFPNG